MKLEYRLRLKIKRNDWLLVDTSSQSLRFILSLRMNSSFITSRPGLEVIKLEFILRLKIKHNDWLLADTSPQAANHCALF